MLALTVLAVMLLAQVAARERHGLEDRIRIVASAKLITPDKVAWALCIGADFVSSARGFISAWVAFRR
jgi:glutamate synthase domain-containing protein 2